MVVLYYQVVLRKGRRKHIFTKNLRGIFLLLPHALALMVGPYADSSKLSYTTTNPTPHYILYHRQHPPCLGKSPAITPGVLRTPSVLALWLRPRAYGQVNRAFGPASLILLLTHSLTLMVRPYADISELSYATGLRPG